MTHLPLDALCGERYAFINDEESGGRFNGEPASVASGECEMPIGCAQRFSTFGARLRSRPKAARPPLDRPRCRRHFRLATQGQRRRACGIFDGTPPDMISLPITRAVARIVRRMMCKPLLP
jgi:hypothetical protein